METWCASELLKERRHRGQPADLWFWRSADGGEVDVLIDRGDRLLPVEVKSAVTPHPNLTAGPRKLRTLNERDPDIRVEPGYIVYGGSEERQSGDDLFLPWHAIDQVAKALG